MLTLEEIHALDVIHLERLIHVGGKNHRKKKNDCPICKHDLTRHWPICAENNCICLRSEALKCQLMIIEHEKLGPLNTEEREALIYAFLAPLVSEYGPGFWKVTQSLRHADTQTDIHAKTATESE